MALVQPDFGDAGRGPGLAERAGIVEGDIEAAIGVDRQCNQGLGVFLRAHVARERDRAAAGGLDLGDEACEFALAPGADHHFRTFGSEQLGGGSADARACAGNDGYLVLKTSDPLGHARGSRSAAPIAT